MPLLRRAGAFFAIAPLGSTAEVCSVEDDDEPSARLSSTEADAEGAEEEAPLPLLFSEATKSEVAAIAAVLAVAGKGAETTCGVSTTIALALLTGCSTTVLAAPASTACRAIAAVEGTAVVEEGTEGFLNAGIRVGNASAGFKFWTCGCGCGALAAAICTEVTEAGAEEAAVTASTTAMLLLLLAEEEEEVSGATVTAVFSFGILMAGTA